MQPEGDSRGARPNDVYVQGWRTISHLVRSCLDLLTHAWELCLGPIQDKGVLAVLQSKVCAICAGQGWKLHRCLFHDCRQGIFALS